MTEPCNDEPHMTPLRYLAALWGNQNKVMDKSGPEKRLEIDFQAPIELSSKLFSWDDWEPILEVLGVAGSSAKSSPYGLSIVAHEISVTINTVKLVMTSRSTVDLHLIFKHVVDLCESAKAPFHWASFMHKESTRLSARSTNTLEYATLHEVFPTGHPFFLGPITSDHYFCFIYDKIDRADPKVHEDEVQVNAVFYGVKGLPTDQNELVSVAQSVLGGTKEEMNIVFGKNDSEMCSTRFLDQEFFAALRTTRGPLGMVVTFETNVSDESKFKAILTTLRKTLDPQRFSVLLLLDPQSTPKVNPQGALSFEKFSVWNATTCELHGYVVKEINFVASC